MSKRMTLTLWGRLTEQHRGALPAALLWRIYTHAAKSRIDGVIVNTSRIIDSIKMILDNFYIIEDVYGSFGVMPNIYTEPTDSMLHTEAEIIARQMCKMAMGSLISHIHMPGFKSSVVCGSKPDGEPFELMWVVMDKSRNMTRLDNINDAINTLVRHLMAECEDDAVPFSS